MKSLREAAAYAVMSRVSHRLPSARVVDIVYDRTGAKLRAKVGRGVRDARAARRKALP